MKRLTELLLRMTELVEAEGRTLRNVVVEEGRTLKKTAARMSLGIAVLFIVAPLAILGLAMLFVAMFLGLKEGVGAPWAAAMTGAATLLVCGGLLWLFKVLTA